MYFFRVFSDGISWIDFPTQWRICVYTLRGIDIYPLRGSNNFLPDVGYIYAGLHASPWGCLLQSIFYGGFLSFEMAKIYFLAANSVVLSVASYLLFEKTSCLNVSEYSLVLSLLSLNFFYSVHEGNCGGMICALLVTAWLLRDDHPYISGMLIAFSMVKPQDALIVCILLLMMKRIKPLIVVAVIDISAWAAVSFLTGKGMFELLREFLFMPSENVSKPFAGIFTLLFDDYLTAVAMSMIAGIIFVAVLHILLPKDMPEIFKIYPAFMAITFWCYSYSNDSYVLVLPSCLCLWLMLHSGRKILWLLCALLCSLGLPAQGAVARIITSVNGTLASGWYAKSLYELGIILIGFLICIELRRIYPEARQ